MGLEATIVSFANVIVSCALGAAPSMYMAVLAPPEHVGHGPLAGAAFATVPVVIPLFHSTLEYWQG